MTLPRTWSLVAPGYAAEIAPTFSRFAEDALARARLSAGERVLDVATGPGTLALAAARAGARVSAIDFSPQMIVELTARAQLAAITGIDARVADATALPYDADTFDAVFSMFALNLVPDHAAALREIHRVVRPGGRIVVGTPQSMARSPVFTEILDILRGTVLPPDFDGTFPLAEPAELQRAVSAAGFADVGVETVTRTLAYLSLAALWSSASRAAAPLVVARDAMGEERWSHASKAIVAELERRFGAGPQKIDLPVNLAHARKT